MESQVMLSIAVVTMNRAEQLKEALYSCLECNLPKETEFVIIDNASTDNTQEIVKQILGGCGFCYYYEKLEENLGVGGGRNYAFAKAQGEFFYSLDDDAVISPDNKNFFLQAIEIFNDERIATLTTQIYDEAWKENRVKGKGNEISSKCRTCFSFCGGSHFLRRAVFEGSPYIPNKYGYEELLPSFKVYDKGMKNAFCEKLLIIHKPKVNKWDYSNEKNYSLLIKDCALPYSIKKMMYPSIFNPILYLGYKKRCKKYFCKNKELKSSAKKMIKDTVINYKITYKMKVKSVIRMYKEFGVTVF